ncbi:hypothetical protein [Streptomyces sp. NPDC052036]|uniref:hypothetical protein n=1 Tax=Streptomyces sp. NPDC052036 TaxID=3155171 RepID=UPI00343CF8F3
MVDHSGVCTAVELHVLLKQRLHFPGSPASLPELVSATVPFHLPDLLRVIDGGPTTR